jgi:hypothetical protein
MKTVGHRRQRTRPAAMHGGQRFTVRCAEGSVNGWLQAVQVTVTVMAPRIYLPIRLCKAASA